LRQGAIATAAIVLLSVLFVLSRPSDPGAHAGILDQLRGIRESEETLGRLVLQIRTRRLLTAEPIVALEQSLDQSLTTIRRDPAMQEQRLATLLDRYAVLVAARNVAVQGFTSSIAVYRKSSLDLPILAHDVSQRMRAAAHPDVAAAIADWDRT